MFITYVLFPNAQFHDKTGRNTKFKIDIDETAKCKRNKAFLDKIMYHRIYFYA